MDAPKEGNVDTKSCNKIKDKKCGCVSHSIPADMNSGVRRQYLQEMVKALPASIQTRIAFLKGLQLEHQKVDAEFYEEVYKLEQKYQLKFQPLFDKRKEIVEGTVDPATKKPEAEEAEHPNHNGVPQDAKGIPGFWLTVFRNVAILSDMVQPRDQPALRKLTDISVKYVDGHSYTLEFHFDQNEYFTNSVLTKRYVLKSVDPEEPFAFEGPEIGKCTGCAINWKEKMNLTVKIISKKQKHKQRGAVRTIVNQVPTESFFNFFNPPEVPANNEEIDDESLQILATDFKVGHLLRAKIIPAAVLYYTGDFVYDESETEEDEEELDENEFEKFDEFDDDEPAKGESQPEGVVQKQSPNDCPSQ